MFVCWRVFACSVVFDDGVCFCVFCVYAGVCLCVFFLVCRRVCYCTGCFMFNEKAKTIYIT